MQLIQVLLHYKEERFDFLLRAFNSPNYLEDLTGLSQLYAQTFDDQVSTCLYIVYNVLCAYIVAWKLSFGNSMQ